jgi:hypothetical protein
MEEIKKQDSIQKSLAIGRLLAAAICTWVAAYAGTKGYNISAEEQEMMVDAAMKTQEATTLLWIAGANMVAGLATFASKMRSVKKGGE